MNPHGLAMLDFYNGDTSAKIIIHRDDGHKEELPASKFFRNPSEFSPIEEAAIKLCRGSILDAGAGAGPHSLVLQNNGFSVCAIDISPEAVEVMHKRGVKNVHCADIFNYAGGKFDTILMMMHGIGMVENLSGLNKFLAVVKEKLKPNGQILLDSMDARHTNDPAHLNYHEKNRRAGNYFGEFRLQFEYKGKKGASFTWLHIDPETLKEHALKAGWSTDIIVPKDENGNYLARLTFL